MARLQPESYSQGDRPAPRLILEGRRWEAQGLGAHVPERYRPAVLSWSLVADLLDELEHALRAEFELELDMERRAWELERAEVGDWLVHRRARAIYDSLSNATAHLPFEAGLRQARRSA